VARGNVQRHWLLINHSRSERGSYLHEAGVREFEALRVACLEAIARRKWREAALPTINISFRRAIK
jgi:hypothetical protein